MKFTPTFWRKSQYKNYEEALQQGGVYPGEICYGFTTYADAMCCAKAAAECVDSSSVKDDLQVHLVVDGEDLGDFPIEIGWPEGLS
jgi:hypothetical protein